MGHGLFHWMMAASLVALHAGAQAGTAASSATIANVQFAVVDLNAGDGIAPAYSFVSNTGAIAESFIPSGSALLVGGQLSTTFGAFSPMSQEVGTPGVSAGSASIGMNSMSANAVETTANSNRSGLASVSAGQNNGSFATPVFSRLLLVLTPQTGLTVTADYAASATLQCSPADQAANQCSSSSFAYGQTNGAYVVATGQPANGVTASSAVSVQATNSGSQALSGASFWVSNASPDFIIVSLTFNAAANASLGNVSSVAEPHSAAMLAAGLGLLALRRRARARRVAGSASTLQ